MHYAMQGTGIFSFLIAFLLSFATVALFSGAKNFQEVLVFHPIVVIALWLVLWAIIYFSFFFLFLRNWRRLMKESGLE